MSWDETKQYDEIDLAIERTKGQLDIVGLMHPFDYIKCLYCSGEAPLYCICGGHGMMRAEEVTRELELTLEVLSK